MNKFQEKTFLDNDFVTWYKSLSKKEQKEVWKEIRKRMEEECEKFLQTLTEVKDIKLGESYTFTVEKFENLSNTLSSIYKTTSIYKTERE